MNRGAGLVLVVVLSLGLGLVQDAGGGPSRSAAFHAALGIGRSMSYFRAAMPCILLTRQDADALKLIVQEPVFKLLRRYRNTSAISGKSVVMGLLD